MQSPISSIAKRHVSLCAFQSIPTCPKPSRFRNFSVASASRQEPDGCVVERARWAQTPQRMRAPVRVRPRPRFNTFKVNENPKRLDLVMGRVLGAGGERLLTEEVKWLTVTHKSFDHGRRGFNDRLAYLGKNIVELESSLATINSSIDSRGNSASFSKDQYGREPFRDPALNGLANLTARTKAQISDRSRLAQLATRYGLKSVLRWKPKKADNLMGSGIELVLNQALYAIVGAIALQKGGKVASRVVRERILNPLGVV